MKEHNLQKAIKGIMSSYLTDRNPDFNKISEKILKVIKKETNSQYGFVGYVDEKSGYLSVPTLSGNALKECKIKGREFIFNNFDTVYGKAIKDKRVFISNDLQKDMCSRKMPEGHVNIKNFIAVPAVIKNSSVGILALGNKDGGYTSRDAQFLYVIAGFYAMIICNLINLKKVEEQNESMREMIENSRDIIYTVDPSGQIEYMNKRYRDYGYEENEIIGHNVKEFCHKDDLEMVMSALSRAVKTGRTKDVLKYRVLKKDGSFFYANQKSTVLTKNGKVYKIVGSIRDSTRERENEIKMANQKEMLNSIYEFAPDIIYIKSPSGVYLNANRAACHFMKKSKRDIVGHTDYEIFGAELSEKIKRDEAELYSGRIVKKIYELNGQTLDVVKTAIKDADGNISFILAIARDITRIKKMENELAMMKAKEKIKRITSELSHDINNTLAVMAGYATLMEENMRGEKGEKESLKIISKSIKKASSIVQSFRKKIDREEI